MNCVLRQGVLGYKDRLQFIFILVNWKDLDGKWYDEDQHIQFCDGLAGAIWQINIT